jgi:hypothetical protein
MPRAAMWGDTPRHRSQLYPFPPPVPWGLPIQPTALQLNIFYRPYPCFCICVGEMFVCHTTDEFVLSPFFSPTAAISACACQSASWRHRRPGDRSPLAQPLAKPRRQGAGALPPASACPTVPPARRLSPRSLDYAGAQRPARPDQSFAAAPAFCA